MKSKQLLTLSILYFLTVISFSIYWSLNYSNYGTKKGDEFITFAAALLLITFGFLFVTYLFISRIHIALLISLPVIILFVTFFAGTALALLFNTKSPRSDIICYGLTYGLLGIYSMYLFFYKSNSKINHSPKSNA
jgi:membrane-associated HD superfamily phosphohydrolase